MIRKKKKGFPLIGCRFAKANQKRGKTKNGQNQETPRQLQGHLMAEQDAKLVTGNCYTTEYDIKEPSPPTDRDYIALNIGLKYGEQKILKDEF
ncbi:hypothetical protein CEXT_188541 [Caerostris extrusa]|uniref:Uncharacterized protein n=1 Tax=Caerostris extrusa TaxID=172846 RepID=A0AAV4UA08_CAEEX|nr:hypothetical protein CEXT_188541 [Caerostris extrusa]